MKFFMTFGMEPYGLRCFYRIMRLLFDPCSLYTAMACRAQPCEVTPSHVWILGGAAVEDPP